MSYVIAHSPNYRFAVLAHTLESGRIQGFCFWHSCMKPEQECRCLEELDNRVACIQARMRKDVTVLDGNKPTMRDAANLMLAQFGREL